MKTVNAHAQPADIWMMVAFAASILVVLSVLMLSQTIRQAVCAVWERFKRLASFAVRHPFKFCLFALFVAVFIVHGATKTVEESITAVELATPVETPDGVDFAFSPAENFDLTGKWVVIERRKLGRSAWTRVAKVSGTSGTAHADGFTLDQTYEYRARVLAEDEN